MEKPLVLCGECSHLGKSCGQNPRGLQHLGGGPFDWDCVTKCVTDKIYPLKVLILEEKNSKQFCGQFRPFFPKSETILPKQFFLNIFVLLFQTPGCLGTCVFGVTSCVMPTRALVQLLHGQIKLDVREAIFTVLYCTLLYLAALGRGPDISPSG